MQRIQCLFLREYSKMSGDMGSRRKGVQLQRSLDNFDISFMQGGEIFLTEQARFSQTCRKKREKHCVVDPKIPMAFSFY